MSPFPAQAQHLELSDSEEPADWPMWFGMQLTSLMAVVDGLKSSTVTADGLQARLNEEVLMLDTDTSGTDAAYAMSRRQALIAVAAFPLATAADGVTDPAVFLSRCAASLAACWHLLGGSDLRAAAHTVSAYLPDLEVVASRESEHRGLASGLAAQAHRICGIVALHRDRLAFVSLGSKQRQREARTAWTRAVERWPHERRLAALGDRLREL